MPQGPLGERIPFEGVLNCWNDDHDLPDLLLAVSRSGKTGRLHFSNPEGDKVLDLSDGRVVFAESSSQDDGLGQFLLRTGEISLMDYTRVSKMVQPGKRLGALLVDAHVLHEENLTPAVIGQVRSIILGLFRRTESWYRFKEEELEQKESITLDLAVPELILEGVRYVESWRRISKGVGNLESIYQQAPAFEPEWLGVQLDDHVRELVSMLASPTSLAEICEHATLPDFEACRYLWAFRSLGWIGVVDAPVQVAATTPDVEMELPAPAPVEALVAAAPEAPRPTPIPESLLATQLSIETDITPAREEERFTPPPIPEHLIQTQVSVTPPKDLVDVTTAPSLSPPAPRQIPEHLNQTQLSIDPPAATPPHQPRAIPEELLHTQMFEEPPSTIEQPPPGSTGELMESILEGETPPPSMATAPKPPVSAPAVAPPAPTSASPPLDIHATTQFFDGPSALEPDDAIASEPSPPSPAPLPEASPAPSVPEPPAAEASTKAPTEAPSGFEALALGDDLGPPTPPPGSTKYSLPVNPADVATQPSVQPTHSPDAGMASFSDLAYTDDPFADTPSAPVAPLPLVEADAVADEPALPEAVPPNAFAAATPYVPDEPLLPRSRSTEITQESLIPPRRRTDDVEPDSEGLGHTLGVDRK